MAKRKPLRNLRTQAFQQQNGRCFYCNQPMWLESHNELTSRFNVTPRQARCLQCTGEHLTPFSQGGPCDRSNIVAACHYCNRARHWRVKNPRSAPAFKEHVRRRIRKGKWFAPLSSV